MSQYRTHFDGTMIAVPPELVGKPPAEIIVVLDDKPKGTHSIWDVVAKSNGTRTGEDIDKQIAEDRCDEDQA